MNFNPRWTQILSGISILVPLHPYRNTPPKFWHERSSGSDSRFRSKVVDLVTNGFFYLTYMRFTSTLKRGRKTP